MEAPIPENEEQRLQSLHNLNLLDTPLEERFERITRMVCRLLNVPIAAFTLVDEDRQNFKSVQGLNVPGTTRNESFCAHMLAYDVENLVVKNARHDPRFAENPLVKGAPNIVFYAGYPVHAPDGNKIGALCAIDGKPKDLTPEEAETLRDLAGLIETELKADFLNSTQKNLIAELDSAKRLALIDELTRIWNRAGVIELLRRECAEGERREVPLGVVMCDIDHFKAINDKHGHPVGDAVIREIAKRLLSALRTEDAVGRIGGEEFMFVMPACPREDLLEALERIRHKVIAEPVQTDAGPLVVTLSFGGVSAVPEAGTGDALMKRADVALYRAKHAGRNCCMIEDDGEDQTAHSSGH